MRNCAVKWVLAGLLVIGGASAALAAANTKAHPNLEFDHLAPGFVAEARTPLGFPAGTGFATTNPWGEYTAYLMLTDRLGRRTWRLEHNLPVWGTGTAQGSTMYLLEGSKRALLIDTGNPACAQEGVNDLKTLVRWLLAHDNAGQARASPLDFVVANTHSHPDHVGENARMSDRTVYYMDGDWPNTGAPSNYVPVKEGGGPTTHGSGTAVGQIDLGGRILVAINVPPHTLGSIAWLDAANHLMFTGDAIGSSWPYLQWAPLTRAVETLRHLLDVTAKLPDLVILPAHFYQLGALGKLSLPRAQQILGRRYIADLLDAINGVIDGSISGEPFLSGYQDYWAGSGSARFVYTLDNIGRPGEALSSNYRVAAVPGDAQRSFAGITTNQIVNRIASQTTRLYVIRAPVGESLFLVVGSQRALLIGTGSGAPGLESVVKRLIGGLPLDVAILDTDASQTGGLEQLSPANLYTGIDVPLLDSRAKRLGDGDQIDLGMDTAGNSLRLEVQSLAAPGKPSLTLLARSDRLMFVGTALGGMSPAAPLPVADPLALQESLSKWLARVGGRFDNLYATSSPRWFTDPAYLDQLRQVLARALSGRGAGKVSGELNSPADQRITAELAAADAASIVLRKTVNPVSCSVHPQ
jgi:glyoxylase-like metal-dependent hydrolase (beta-lactamase superfamily II)